MKSEVCKSGFWGKKAWKCDSPPAPSTSTALATYSGQTGRWKYFWVSFWNHCASISRKTFHPKITQFYKLTVRHHRSVIEPYFTFEHILPKSLTEMRISRNLYARKYLDKSGIGEVWLKIPRVEIWNLKCQPQKASASEFPFLWLDSTRLW